ncbi:NAD-dependent dehydratase [Candidatus Falkowbacteria bacterium CG11_big_fil_rev_8_21_14_0_20_39_10]|uniref:NAD-dependent dehydratase n=1 Tax=Candidatus Falkowbacteria bacterium CG11_big_fil_rev_8_21_14_0_20_39_10 TaxID=1974570 RepID=A0A2M6K8W6_9BACT|nr:MAG: NAD-dependent dehydratase [Candidatus Falkowbacteria bacterium CG11_big_fil_rev_8_21_14_0_20_39_10]
MSKHAIFDKKNVLVTGGAGFIGSHLCDELIKTAKVICLDNFSTGDERNIDHLLADPNFEFIKHDVSQPIILEDLPDLQKFKIQFQGVQEIYHLACPTSPRNFMPNREATLLANSYGVKNTLDMAKKYQAKFLHFSSSVVYGPRREGNPKIKEEDLGAVDFLSERSSYDEGKRFAETMVTNFRDIHHLDAKIIRIFRTYGPRMKLGEKQMVPDFILNALDNRDLVIHGDESFSSSFCYVGDLVDACLKIMETDLVGPINIGSDVDVKIIDIAQKIINIIGSKSRVVCQEPELFMTPLCLPDITKARNELGWMPVVTLDKGLERTIDDLRASKGLRGVV